MRLKELIEELVRLQEIQNEAISGPEWRKNVSYGNLKMAAHSEWGEFADEIKPFWCWWKSSEYDSEKAIEEFCDVLMFMIAVMTYRNDQTPWFSERYTCAALDHAARAAGKLAGGFTDQRIEVIAGCYENFYVDSSWVNQTRNLAALIQQVCHMLHVDYDVIRDAYVAKIKANSKRENWGANRHA